MHSKHSVIDNNKGNEWNWNKVKTDTLPIALKSLRIQFEATFFFGFDDVNKNDEWFSVLANPSNCSIKEYYWEKIHYLFIMFTAIR